MSISFNDMFAAPEQKRRIRMLTSPDQDYCFHFYYLTKYSGIDPFWQFKVLEWYELFLYYIEIMFSSVKKLKKFSPDFIFNFFLKQGNRLSAGP